MDLHVPPLIAILQEDVFTTQLPANLLDAQITNVTHLPTNVKSLFQAVVMAIHVLLILSTHLPAVSTLQNALLLMHVPLLPVPEEFVTVFQRIVMTEMSVLLTLVIFALELASTLQSLALAKLVLLELATLKLLSVKLDKLVLTTVTVLLMEIQLTFLSVTQILDAPSKLIKIIKQFCN
jgi:hypothetical protein